MPSEHRTPVNQSESLPVRRAHIPPDSTYETMSEMGRDLFKLSREIEKAGEGIMTEEELEQELARRRGGYMLNDDR